MSITRYVTATDTVIVTVGVAAAMFSLIKSWDRRACVVFVANVDAIAVHAPFVGSDTVHVAVAEPQMA
jgi:hypothetical protein